MIRSRPAGSRAALAVSVFLLMFLIPAERTAANGDLPETPPAGQFTIRVKWDGRYVVGISKVTGLIRRTEVVSPRDGGDPNSARKSPGISSYEPLVLERRLTRDAEFEHWANKVWNFGSGLGAEASLRDFRKDVRVELFNEAGDLAMAFHVYRCWPSDYVALGEMRADGSDTPMEILVLQHEGWERDYSVVAPH